MLIWTLPCQNVISLLLAATPTLLVSVPSAIVPVGNRCSSDSARAGTSRSSSPGMVSVPERSRMAMRYESVATIRMNPSIVRQQHAGQQRPAVVVRGRPHHLAHGLGERGLREVGGGLARLAHRRELHHGVRVQA